MSIRIAAGMARLTVLGTGHSNMSIESGDGLTDDGGLLEDIAEELGYDPGDDVDWDLIAEEDPIDWDDVVYEDDDGTLYTDPDGDGIWTDPLTGVELEDFSDVDMWIPEDSLIGLSDLLEDTAASDSGYMGYNIPQEVLNAIKGGPKSQSDGHLDHYYLPACYVIQVAASQSYVFNTGVFRHGDNKTGTEWDITSTTIVIRSGSAKTVYYTGCATENQSNLVPSPYNGYPVAYICWQCLYGPFEGQLITSTEDTITTQQIKAGTSGLETKVIDGQTYYKVSSHHSGKF